jgi:hypothetical protein
VRHPANAGFILSGRDIRSDILVPRYYDPRIKKKLGRLASSHDLLTIQDFIKNGWLLHNHGSYIPKIHYGTGPFPYIRTSDLANWELKASPKHGVSQAVYEEYSSEQDVKPSDILFVHEGTYLIGSSAMVTPYDGPLLYQHHLAKFRVLPGGRFGPYFFLAALDSEIVQSQFRARQFSADIIDSIVGRIGEVIIPIPKSRQVISDVEDRVREDILGRAEIKERLSYILRAVDRWLSGDVAADLSSAFKWRPDPSNYLGKSAFLGSRKQFVAFVKKSSEIQSEILIPKYYDPTISAQFPNYRKRCNLQTVGEMQSQGLIDIATGDEIGNINYGTGDIPFVRTSDFGSWELIRTPKQGISREIYDKWNSKQDIAAGDVLLVRDGTYLVGTSVTLFNRDLPLLYCGGLLRLRCTQPEKISPALLFVLLNIPFVKLQLRNKQFTRDVIDTLGRRLTEVVLPIPHEKEASRLIGSHVHKLLETRSALLEDLKQLNRDLFH